MSAPVRDFGREVAAKRKRTSGAQADDGANEAPSQQFKDLVLGQTGAENPAHCDAIVVEVTDLAGEEMVQAEKEAVCEAMSMVQGVYCCLLYTSPSPRDRTRSRMPSSA